MNILERIDQALTGRPPKPEDPTITGSNYIVGVALPGIQSQLGSEFTDWLKGRKSLRKLEAERNGLNDVAAYVKWQSQVDEHAALASDGHDIIEKVTRGRSREAWEADYRSRQASVDKAMGALVSKLRPTETKIIVILIETLNFEASKAMIEEMKVSKKYGFTYTKSPLIGKLLGLNNYLTNRGGLVIEQLCNK